MGYIGVIGEELMRAMSRVGLAPSRQVRLHALADDAVKRHGVGDAAVSSLDDAIEADPAMLLQIIDEIKFRKPLIRRFIEGRAAALRAQGAHVPAGQWISDALPLRARRDEPNTNPATDGQRSGDSHCIPASRSPEPETNGFANGDAPDYRAVRMPGHAKRGLGTIAAVAPVVARGLLQSTVIDGRHLGDMTPREAMQHVARENVTIAKERAALESRHGRASLIARICRDLDPDKRISAQITEDEAAQRAAA